MPNEFDVWNRAIEMAMREIALQATSRHLSAWSPEYVLACKDCIKRVALLKEPRVTEQQIAEMMIGLLEGKI